mmetsp:Transcript_87648/g.234665  ORF Transcript_87648/g.234665 Transcript_87648/m.234665 type:complete len:310 (+) Transcript_87648:1015-1944(+)
MKVICITNLADRIQLATVDGFEECKTSAAVTVRTSLLAEVPGDTQSRIVLFTERSRAIRGMRLVDHEMAGVTDGPAEVGTVRLHEGSIIQRAPCGEFLCVDRCSRARLESKSPVARCRHSHPYEVEVVVDGHVSGDGLTIAHARCSHQSASRQLSVHVDPTASGSQRITSFLALFAWQAKEVVILLVPWQRSLTVMRRSSNCGIPHSVITDALPPTRVLQHSADGFRRPPGSQHRCLHVQHRCAALPAGGQVVRLVRALSVNGHGSTLEGDSGFHCFDIVARLIEQGHVLHPRRVAPFRFHCHIVKGIP